jgi:D-glycero-alpha-D-manno-heptose 1-phosphate guanylyltransferase
MECIVLAGGLGTRIKSAIGDTPKAMAEVNGRPFLYYLFQYLESQECTRVILSLGYKAETIIEWVRAQSYGFEIDQVIEQQPLGTGGGIQLAIKQCKEEDVAVINGDTLFETDLNALIDFHVYKDVETTLALKKMNAFDRYGTVAINDQHRVVSFSEKKFENEGLINGGIYIINRDRFLKRRLPEVFSFEKDYLGKYVSEGNFCGLPCDDYFIDIGIPEDYKKAAEDFKELF